METHLANYSSFNYYSGVDQARRDREMERLNKCYGEIIAEKNDINSCLSHMINTESYRMLSGWSYSLKPECLRLGSRAFELPESTDVNKCSHL